MALPAFSAKPMWLRFKERRASASDILLALEIYRPPVDVRAIVQRLEIHLHETLNPGWDGALRSDESEAHIWVRIDASLPRQRFTIAHELGHLLLHPLGEEFRDTKFLGTPQEVEANRFAAELLMPEPMIYEFAKWADYDAEKLADLFVVSKVAMQIRLTSVLRPT